MCKKLIVLVFCAAVLFSGVAMAEVDENGRLIVPKTSVAPIIDAELDDIWQNVGEESLLITEIINATSAVPEDLNDLSATFQVMHDDDNFYIYVVIQDSVIDYEFSNHNGDGVEIFFDGDNSKGSSYDGVNDNQIRITVDDVELANIDSSLPVDGSAFKVILTDLGYNIEASFPLEKLQIVPENTFGFEVQINDNDGGGGRETLIRWFSNDNNSWQDASLFGEAVLTAEPAPDGWQSQDIDTTGGSAAESDGTWTISADGADIWGNSDQFHYVYRELTGDATITARVVDNGTGSNAWAKGGVMIRQSLDGDSINVFGAITGGEGGGGTFQWRPVQGDRSDSSQTLTIAPPYYVRLVREGNTFTAYMSADGVDWAQQGADPVTIEMTDPVLIGLAVTSHQDGEVRTFTFDNVRVVSPDVIAIEEVLNQYAVSANAGDLELWLSLHADDVVKMPPDAPAIFGIEELRANFKPAFDNFNTSCVIYPEEAYVDGDLGYARGTYSILITPKAGGETISLMPDGKYLTILKRQPDGSWKISHDCYNSNVPPTPPPLE